MTGAPLPAPAVATLWQARRRLRSCCGARPPPHCCVDRATALTRPLARLDALSGVWYRPARETGANELISLGFNCHAHNAAACVLVDGRPVAAGEEERFSRRKGDGRLPRAAVEWCLRESGVSIGDLDHVTFHWLPFLGFARRLLHVARHALDVGALAGAHAGTWRDLLLARRSFDRLAGELSRSRGTRPRYAFHRIPHHHAHAASAFFGSPFDEAAILVMDGTGEIASTSLGVGRGNGLELFEQIDYPHSMGYLFVALTDYLGFRPESDEYKLMSLASFGSDEYVPAFRDIVHLDGPGRFAVDLSYVNYHRGVRDPWVSPRFVARFGPPRRPGEPVTERHAAVARGLQRRLEDVGLHLARHLARRTGARNLCLAGGVALNGVMNGRLLREGPFERIFVMPASGDAGCSLGGPWYLHHVVLGRPRVDPLGHVYLGPRFDPAACQAAYAAAGLTPWVASSEEELLAAVVGHLVDGKVVGWFQGRMELGPRALGNRSILADPRRPEMKDVLNARVKFREWFRPFAPSVLEDRCGDFFGRATPSPYMLRVYPTRPECAAVLPAVTHVDGGARVQTVAPEQNARYHALIAAFGRRTGVPVVLNTSFNIRGEPIVNSVADALKCFYTTDMDFLAVGPYLLEKRPGLLAEARGGRYAQGFGPLGRFGA